MSKHLLIIAVTGLLVSGCANGWPHTHHLTTPKTVGATCTRTGSHISTQGCSMSQPASSTAQSDYDRQGLGTAGTPLQTPGSVNPRR